MANRDINEEMDQLKEDLKSLHNDVSSLLDAMREAGVEEARAAQARARAYGEQARTKVREGVDTAQQTIGREIEERPVTSILTAFGVGFVVGMLLERRH